MLFLIFIGYCAYDAICAQGGAIEHLSTVRGWIEERMSYHETESNLDVNRWKRSYWLSAFVHLCQSTDDL